MKYAVTYENGTTVDYKVKPRHLVAFEEDHGSFDDQSVAMAMRLAHIVSGDPRDFHEWLDDVDEIETLGVVGDQPVGTSTDGKAGEPVPTEGPSPKSRRRSESAPVTSST